MSRRCAQYSARPASSGDASPLTCTPRVTAFQDALTCTPPGHPDRALLLSNLGGARLAREWDEVLTAIRAGEGFEHFLASVPYATLRADLRTAALDGPVVIVNASPYGCHALIVDTESNRPR